MKNYNLFDLENKYYESLVFQRFQKKIFQYEIYKKIKNIKGDFVETGVFKGNSFIRFSFYRNLVDGNSKRKMYGFDSFGKFPNHSKKYEKKPLNKFIRDAGEYSISRLKLYKNLTKKNITNFELVKGDLLQTIPQYSKKIKKISLLHIDTDLYVPCKVVLQHMYNKVSKGGIILFDNYKIFPGETRAVDEFLKNNKIKNFLIKDYKYYLQK